MNYFSLSISLLICFNLSMITIYADVIANPLVWLIADPVLIIGLISLVIILTILLKPVKTNHNNSSK